MKEADVSVDVAVPDEYVNDVSSIVIVVSHPYNVVPRIKFSDGILPETVVFAPTSQSWQPGQPLHVCTST